MRDLGTKLDDIRRSKIRVDSEERKNMVEKARSWIFEKGRAVTSEAIDNYLKFSTVPIRVIFFVKYVCLLADFLPECIFAGTL